jgi:hypothetical protein
MTYKETRATSTMLALKCSAIGVCLVTVGTLVREWKFGPNMWDLMKK